MEHISDRTVQTTDQLAGPAGSPEGSAGWSGSPSVHITGRETSRPVRPGPVPVPERIADEIVGPGGELVFDDARPSDRVRRSGARPVAPEFRSDRARKQAFHAMEHRQWHWRGPIVVIVILVVFGALAFIGSRRSNHSTTKTSISTSAGAATYSVGVSTYNIVITASGLCWVDAVDASSGNAIFSGTVQPGAIQVIHATGATNVTVGASFASMTANNIPVVLPTPFQVPFTATFQPPASTASTTTTTTTSPGTS
jgi:hypothetical protein